MIGKFPGASFLASGNFLFLLGLMSIVMSSCLGEPHGLGRLGFRVVYVVATPVPAFPAGTGERVIRNWTYQPKTAGVYGQFSAMFRPYTPALLVRAPEIPPQFSPTRE